MDSEGHQLPRNALQSRIEAIRLLTWVESFSVHKCVLWEHTRIKYIVYIIKFHICILSAYASINFNYFTAENFKYIWSLLFITADSCTISNVWRVASHIIIHAVWLCCDICKVLRGMFCCLLTGHVIFISILWWQCLEVTWRLEVIK
jgi:hypothetical protein